jgi:hypothetical protein
MGLFILLTIIGTVVVICVLTFSKDDEPKPKPKRGGNQKPPFAVTYYEGQEPDFSNVADESNDANNAERDE